MSTRSEKSAFSVVGLAHGFLSEAEKLGLTPALLQRLRESPERMAEFVLLARRAEEDYLRRIDRLQYEWECAVDVGGIHHHLVLITRAHLLDWGCGDDFLISEVVRLATLKGYKSLHEDVYTTVSRILMTVPLPGEWIGWTSYEGVVRWERTHESVKFVSSYGSSQGMSLSHFSGLAGVVCMVKFVGCDFNHALKR